MGFFSFTCHHCDHPLLSSCATTDGVNEWMSEAVVVAPHGDFHSGEYDGYGNVGGSDYSEWEGGTAWHRGCWEVAGKSLDFHGEAASARDQGFFFADGEHDLPDPRSMSAGQFDMACTDLTERLKAEEEERSEEEFFGHDDEEEVA